MQLPTSLSKLECLVSPVAVSWLVNYSLFCLTAETGTQLGSSEQFLSCVESFSPLNAAHNVQLKFSFPPNWTNCASKINRFTGLFFVINYDNRCQSHDKSATDTPAFLHKLWRHYAFSFPFYLFVYLVENILHYSWIT